MMAGTGVGVGGGGMLRTRRRDVSVKPNRKLDRKSSRGMIYENEELRLRTIHINAEVEQGKDRGARGTERGGYGGGVCGSSRARARIYRRLVRGEREKSRLWVGGLKCVLTKGRHNTTITLPFVRFDRAELMGIFVGGKSCPQISPLLSVVRDTRQTARVELTNYEFVGRHVERSSDVSRQPGSLYACVRTSR